MLFVFRLEHANSQLTPLIQKANILRRTSLRYKQRLERRYSDLQKAEAEVCLLKPSFKLLFDLCGFWKFKTWFTLKWYYGYLLHVFILWNACIENWTSLHVQVRNDKLGVIILHNRSWIDIVTDASICFFFFSIRNNRCVN